MASHHSKSLRPGSAGQPEIFGGYYLLGHIARGGMAEVYRARLRHEAKPARLRAIKVMRDGLANEAKFVDMFHREGKLAMLLKHRNVVATFDIGQVEEHHYIAMEYIAGRDLTAVLRRCQETQTRLTVPQAVYIAARVAEGLHYAHMLSDGQGRMLNIVNRDVSPSNVRLSYDGEVKILDFGIAQAMMKFTTEIGILKGKFSYMSPEQIRGMPLDARTDVFSVGILLHEMLTTEKLFRGDTEFALMEKVRKAEAPPPSQFNRRVPPELDKIVATALARDVTDRYQTASLLMDELDQLAASYRFSQSELRETLQKMFRREYDHECAENAVAASAEPAADGSPELPWSAPDHDTLDQEPDTHVRTFVNQEPPSESFAPQTLPPVEDQPRMRDSFVNLVGKPKKK